MGYFSIKLMDIKAIVIFSLSLFHASLLCAQTLPSISHQFYHQYEGDFYFDDSSYITGGPSDEIKGSLLYIDPPGLSRGGVFQPVDSLQFKSLVDKDVSIKFSTNSGGEIDGLWWLSATKAPQYALKKKQSGSRAGAV